MKTLICITMGAVILIPAIIAVVRAEAYSKHELVIPEEKFSAYFISNARWYMVLALMCILCFWFVFSSMGHIFSEMRLDFKSFFWAGCVPTAFVLCALAAYRLYQILLPRDDIIQSIRKDSEEEG